MLTAALGWNSAYGLYTHIQKVHQSLVLKAPFCGILNASSCLTANFSRLFQNRAKFGGEGSFKWAVIHIHNSWRHIFHLLTFENVNFVFVLTSVILNYRLRKLEDSSLLCVNMKLLWYIIPSVTASLSNALAFREDVLASLLFHFIISLSARILALQSPSGLSKDMSISITRIGC